MNRDHLTRSLATTVVTSTITFCVCLLLPDLARGQETSQAYSTRIRPLLKQFCFECHSNDRAEAEIDLDSFKSVANVRKRTKVWLRVREMLDSGQMPPKDAKQPSDKQRDQLRKWVRDFLTAEAKARAGDPGPVVIRRLSNAEYTYTLRDLTGISLLDPAREFPVDGAAGEGFTNTGSALVMSPSLITKYLDAAKEVARHAVLLPDGMRFSPHATRRDWTDEYIAQIQAFYDKYTVSRGGSAVNLQGIRFETNKGGRLALDRYLAATIAERDAIRNGTKTVGAVANEHGLNAKYLATLWNALNGPAEGQSLLDQFRVRWQTAKIQDVPALVGDIGKWQAVLWKFNTIGHIGKAGQPKEWMVPAMPLAAQREFRLKLPEVSSGEVVVYLSASDAGDGNVSDFVLWRNARLEGGNRAPLLLRDLAGVQARIAKLRRDMFNKTAKYLAAVEEVKKNALTADQLAALSKKHDIDSLALTAWLNYLNVGIVAPVKVEGHFTNKMLKGGNYDFVQGWGSGNTPLILANSSDQQVRIPGISRPHSVVVHPSPTLFAAVGWSSPMTGIVKIEARISDAHPECGNGVEWYLQHQTGRKVGNLWKGDMATSRNHTMQTKSIGVRAGDLISFVVGPRGGNHSCDLTELHLTITETTGKKRVWNLAKDISGNILKSNPHADQIGNKQTWHFYKGPMTKILKQQDRPVVVPPGSRLARWVQEKNATKRKQLAVQVQELLTGKPPANSSSPDGVLYKNLQSLALPTDSPSLTNGVKPDPRFGKHPMGQKADGADLIVKALQVVEFRIPAELASKRELVVTGLLDSISGREGSVQLQVATTKFESKRLAPEFSVIATDGSNSKKRISAGFAAFRNLFPPALCYHRIVPVDEVVTLTLYFREDQALKRLMLNKEQIAQLDRLWDQLFFVAREPLAYQVAFEQIREFATQDRPDLVKLWSPLVGGVNARADAFRKRLLKTEPVHVEALIELTSRAWRRPLKQTEERNVRALYKQLRDGEIPHEEAIRLTLARVLTSPAFLYRPEKPGDAKVAVPVSNRELASRLSYFLWSSTPDDDLRDAAETRQLTKDETLLTQTRRMLKDARVRRLAIQFACQWLHIRNFDQDAEKNEKLYPNFAKIRAAMYEESVRFFEDMFRNDGSILNLLNADHTFLNEELAKLYGINGVSGSSWRRVDGVKQNGRGGVLGMATFLASQSGASRTSPILRGNWIFETLLGERLPRPPANVPQLPETVPSNLTARQLIEKHSSVPECAKCHEKIDPYGFALEQFDAIGRRRTKSVDVKTKLPDGETIEGITGLRDYLVNPRRNDVVRQFCRKLLGYALGREVQLSDEPLLSDMQSRLKSRDYRFSAAVEMIVTSRQFRQIRGRLMEEE